MKRSIERLLDNGLVRTLIAMVVVVLLSCEMGCAPKPIPPQVASTKLAEDIGLDMETILAAYTEAAKKQMREKFCPKP